ncbi:MAG TPA: alpha/beta hydrolase [Nocardioides sp.]|uniref:alpha/beta hydrolase n=1 Tax=uncultured Nocardioides sp. TaxID=198441 RepID=UPI000EE7D14A|nr:alpha/beta hydrolase [uncultured Nocardioides sp.]HCB06095.1 alpha/beta hydrolase [Nocardioides sp.]HRD63447.1 alpha/beta hydrolase [Nocardioides sp.]HRI99029.1 alpha/beta hydrolase [Nocardioides sp.]HRK46532.1 alpha/beta hydrolase [Nocardioides sp.]
MSIVTEREAAEVAAANASGRPPVVFVHGLWLLASSWDAWKELFEAKGYAAVSVDWPGDQPTYDEAHANKDSLAGTSVADVADHVAEVVAGLDQKPILIGHSFGGLLVQIVAGRGLAAGTVSIDPAPSRGVLPLPFSALKASFPVLGNPLNHGKTVTLTFDQFRYGFANAVSEEEAHRLYETFHTPAPGRPLFQAATANLIPWTVVKAEKQAADRGPMLVISGEKDHIVPYALAHAAYKQQKKNSGVTEFVEIPGVGHSLVIDSHWNEVADAALAFLDKQGLTPQAS